MSLLIKITKCLGLLFLIIFLLFMIYNLSCAFVNQLME